MQIKLAKTAGFCFGVNRAVELLYDKVEAGEQVCTLGPIIHNAQLVGDLAERGVKIIDRVEDCPPGYQIVVRTHGVDKCVVEEMEARHLPFTECYMPLCFEDSSHCGQPVTGHHGAHCRRCGSPGSGWYSILLPRRQLCV